MDSKTFDADRVMPAPAVLQKVNLSRTTIWRMVKRGEFPKPIRLSPGRVGWSANTVEQWLASKMEAA